MQSQYPEREGREVRCSLIVEWESHDHTLQVYSYQGVIQDFEAEGEMRKMLLKKGQLLFQYPAMDTQSYNYYLKGGGVSPLSPLYDTLVTLHTCKSLPWCALPGNALVVGVCA